MYTIPKELRLSRPCRDLVSQIFVADPAQRITMAGIRQHPWFLENLPVELQVRAVASHERFF